MSKPVTVDIPHKLGKAEAKRRVQQSFGQMRDQFTAMGISKFEDEWAGDALTFTAKGMGQTITGKLDVLEEALRIEVHLPLFLAGLAEKITGKVRERGALMLEKK